MPERELQLPMQASQKESQQHPAASRMAMILLPSQQMSNQVVSLNRNDCDEDQTLDSEPGAAASREPALMENLKSEPVAANTASRPADGGDDFANTLSDGDLTDQLGSHSPAVRAETDYARELGQAACSNNGPDLQIQSLESTSVPMEAIDRDHQRPENELTHQIGDLNIMIPENGDFNSLAAQHGSFPSNSLQSDTALESTCDSVVTRKAKYNSSTSSKPGFSSLSSASLDTDGGNEANKERIIVHHQGFSLGREYLNVSVVNFLMQKDVLRKAEQDGFFAVPTLLLKVEWLGHRRFNLSRWKMSFRSPFTDNHVHLCSVLQDVKASVLCRMLKQLKHCHAVFLQEIHWDDGLVIILGHTNPQTRLDCLQSPVREQIEDILQLLLPDTGQNAVLWQEPAEANEEESEAACISKLLAQRLMDFTQKIDALSESQSIYVVKCKNLVIQI